MKKQVFVLSMFLISIAVHGLADAPLSRVEVLGLLAGGTPAGEVARRVQQHGISFRPTEDFHKLIARAEAENDPGKEQLTKALLAAPLVSPTETESLKESEILEHLAHGAELAAKVFPPNPREFQATEREFRQALEGDPQNGALHLALANALAVEGNLDAAIPEFREALKAMPDLSAGHANLGRALAGKGSLDEGLAEFREAARLDPASSSARGVLARALLEKHDSRGAIEEMREGLCIRPNDPSMHNTMGTVLYATGDFNSAIAEFWHAIDLGSRDPELHMDLASVLRRKGDIDGAIAQIRDAIRLNPDSFRLHHSLGATLVDKGDLSGANAEYREAIHLKPDYALSHSELGYVLKKQGDLDGAIKEYREAVRLDPKLAVAHLNLAAALYSKGQHDAAYEETLIAHELAPNEHSISAQFDRLPQRYKQRATQPADEPKPPRAPLGEPETANFLYYMDAQNGSLVPLEAETPTIGATSSVFGGAKAYITVIGERSPVRLRTGSKWEFVIRPADATTPLNFRLERYEAKGGSRRLSSKKKLVPSSSADKPGLLIFNSSSYGKSSLKLTIPYDLTPGEYGFFVSAKSGGWKMFCFGVDSP